MSSPFTCTVAIALLAAFGATAQPIPIDCNAATCTFTLSFTSGPTQTHVTTGAPYSGELTRAGQTVLPMTWRDSQGRIRTERPVYQTRPGQPIPPDNFTITEIRDPVAGFQYILDPVTHTAHRTPFKPEAVTTLRRFIGDGERQTISGVEAVVRRVGPTTETWVDPKSGVTLLQKSTGPNGVTMTMRNYSNAEPDPALFAPASDYRVVDETGPFQVTHARAPGADANVGSLIVPASFEASCSQETCTLRYTPGNSVMGAETGAPWSGLFVEERRTTPGGGSAPVVKTSPLYSVARDSAGRSLANPLFPSTHPPELDGGNFGVALLLDPVAGYRYIVDSVNHVAHRIPTKFNVWPFKPPVFLSGGEAINGIPIPVKEEDLGERVISGVTAVGVRRTHQVPLELRTRMPVSIDETWADPKTGAPLVQVRTMPTAITTETIENYKPGDPDPAILKVPSDYKIVDETVPFTFTIPRPK